MTKYIRSQRVAWIATENLNWHPILRVVSVAHLPWSIVCSSCITNIELQIFPCRWVKRLGLGIIWMMSTIIEDSYC